ncbi:MAG: ABC transporter ATP-binding protein [Chloroflexota bacterium]|nr:ABC transporter ATP-binding protein [Chloroflexota bacterium]
MQDSKVNSSGYAAKRGLGRRILGAFKPYWFKVSVVGALILITAGLGVVNPILIRVVFDSALFPPSGMPDLNLLWIIVGVMAGITVVTGALGIVQTYLTNEVGQRVMRDLRDRLYEHLQTLSISFFTDTRTGEIQSRVANDVGGVQNVVSGTVSNVLSNIVIFISTLVAMFVLSWELTVVSMCAVPIFALISKFVGARRRVAAAQTQQASAEVTAITQETLSISGMMLSKLFGRQEREIERFHHENEHLAVLTLRQQMTGRSFFALVQIFFSLTPVLIYLIAGYLLSGDAAQGLSAGTIVAFTTLQSRLFWPIGSLLQVSVELQGSMALFERIFGYLDIEPEIVDADDAVTLDPEDVAGKITLENVRLMYGLSAEERIAGTSAGVSAGLSANGDVVGDGSSVNGHSRNSAGVDGKSNGASAIGISGGGASVSGARRYALDGVDMQIEAGQLAALVGPSGSGKTTISYLIPRLYDVTEGAVKIDDIDVRDIRLESLAPLIGYVSQESYLFHATLRENLLYGAPDASEEQMIAAAKAAFIHDRILEFPDGYDTVVGERGYRLSGGERQRLSIARVILHDPRILILDEATSALDTTSERYVQAALEPLMKGRTTIAIAHRLSTILSADVIFSVEDGRIVEQGTHDELLENDGLYANLYYEQYDGGRVESCCEDGIVLVNGRILSHYDPVPSA